MAQLYASRSLGSKRQLWSDAPRADRGSFLARPEATRRVQGLASLLAARAEAAGSQGGDRDGNDRAIAAAAATESGWATIERVCCGECSYADFEARFRRPSLPAIITGGTATAAWPSGAERWGPEALVESLGAASRLELAGADATVGLGDFAAYMASGAADDNPACVWGGSGCAAWLCACLRVGSTATRARLDQLGFTWIAGAFKEDCGYFARLPCQYGSLTSTLSSSGGGPTVDCAA